MKPEKVVEIWKRLKDENDELLEYPIVREMDVEHRKENREVMRLCRGYAEMKLREILPAEEQAAWLSALEQMKGEPPSFSGFMDWLRVEE